MSPLMGSDDTSSSFGKLYKFNLIDQVPTAKISQETCPAVKSQTIDNSSER